MRFQICHKRVWLYMCFYLLGSAIFCNIRAKWLLNGPLPLHSRRRLVSNAPSHWRTLRSQFFITNTFNLLETLQYKQQPWNDLLFKLLRKFSSHVIDPRMSESFIPRRKWFNDISTGRKHEIMKIKLLTVILVRFFIAKVLNIAQSTYVSTRLVWVY